MTRKQWHVVSLSLICIMIFATACSPQSEPKDIIQRDFDVDLGLLQSETKGLGEDEKNDREQRLYESFRKIYKNDSKSADKVIGEIAGEKVYAREFALRVLKICESESKSPYRDAWEALKLEAAEQEFIKEKHLEEAFAQRFKKYQDELKENIAGDETFEKYLVQQQENFDMSADEYKTFVNTSNKRICRHYFVTDYLEKNNLLPLNTDKIDAKVTDTDYRRMIKIEAKPSI